MMLLHFLFICFFGSGLSLSCGGDVYCVPSAYASVDAAITAAAGSFPITVAIDGPHVEDVRILTSGGSIFNPSVIRTLDSTPQTLTAASTDQPVIYFGGSGWRVESPEGILTLSLPGSEMDRSVIVNHAGGLNSIVEIFCKGLRFHTSGSMSIAISDVASAHVSDFSSSSCTADGDGSWSNMIVVAGGFESYPRLENIQIDSSCCIDAPLYFLIDEGGFYVVVRNLYFVQNSANTVPIWVELSTVVKFYNSVFRSEVSPVTTMMKVTEGAHVIISNSYIHCAAASDSYSSSPISLTAEILELSPRGSFSNTFWDGCSSGSEYLVGVYEDPPCSAMGDWICNRYSGAALMANAGTWLVVDQSCDGVDPGPIPIKRGSLGSVGPGSGWKEYYSLTEQVVGIPAVVEPDFFGVERYSPVSVGPHEFGIACNGISAESSSACSGRGNCTENGCICDSPQDWVGDDCDIVACYGIAENNESSVCGGHGTCESDHTCTCDDIYEDHDSLCDGDGEWEGNGCGGGNSC